MSRYKHLLNTVIPDTTPKIFGLFPFNALINPETTDVHNGKIDFLDSAVEGLRQLASKNYSAILFINQFKTRQLSFEHFNNLNQAIENFINSHGVKVIGIYWCPSIDKLDPFVTPNAGMFTRATENQAIKWSGINVVSSSDADLKAASKANAVPIKIGNGSNWTRYSSFLEWATTVTD